MMPPRRALLGLELPPDAVAALLPAREAFAGGGPPARWVPASDLGVVLLTAELPHPEAIEAVEAAASRVAATRAPFAVALATLVALPSPGGAAVCASLTDPDGALAGLCAALAEALAGYGFTSVPAAGAAPFPHVPLGRLASGAPLPAPAVLGADPVGPRRVPVDPLLVRHAGPRGFIARARVPLARGHDASRAAAREAEARVALAAELERRLARRAGGGPPAAAP